MESVQRVVIRTEVLRKALAANRSLEHPAQRHSIHDAAVDAEADDAPSKLIHHDQNPMRSQGGGLAAKQVATPQAVLGVAEECQPGGTSGICFRPVMDLNPESESDLLGDSRTSPTGIPSLHLEDGVDQLL